MDKKYCFIVKTGDAELRAMQNLSSINLDKILPIVELTRGRRKNAGTKQSPNYIYPYEKKLDKVKEILGNRSFVLDITSDENLSSKEIDRLFDYANGYANWVSEVTAFKVNNKLDYLIPSIIVDYDDDNFEENIKKQILSLASEFNTLMYRCSLDNAIAVEDIDFISKCLPNANELFIVVDCGWVPAASYTNPGNVCIERVSNIKKVLSGCQYKMAICATTFPNNISEIGNDVNDTFKLKEIDLYEMVKAKHSEVIYGDYASINPIRNDQIVMARGWIPRIDVALEREIYYYRKRRPGKSTAYADTYTFVAKQVVADKRFPISEQTEWGYAQIINCSLGDAPSASPSYWISVRMNSHIVQQINRLEI